MGLPPVTPVILPVQYPQIVMLPDFFYRAILTESYKKGIAIKTAGR
jgi:hypothetical protein